MTRFVITPEEWEEMERLLEEHKTASLHGATVLRKYGMDSQEFRDADKATGALWGRIREIQGLSGKHWMA
jgi:hypothetical protein